MLFRSSSVWGVLSFSLNGAVFILLGMQLPRAMQASWSDPYISNTVLIGIILLVTLVVIVLRFLWITAMLRIALIASGKYPGAPAITLFIIKKK